MKKCLPIFFATVLLSVTSAPAVAVEYTNLQTDKSRLDFVYQQMGVSIEGHFRKFAAQFNFDPQKPAAAKVLLELDLASIDAGSAEANEEVAAKAWFNTKAYPQARFVASGIKTLGPQRFEVSGKMTIKGRTVDVTAPFTLVQKANTAIFDGTFVLKRGDFAIGEGVWADYGTVANEIQIKFHFLAQAKK